MQSNAIEKKIKNMKNLKTKILFPLFYFCVATLSAAQITIVTDADYVASGAAATASVVIQNNANATLVVTALVEAHVPAGKIKNAKAESEVRVFSRDVRANSTNLVSFATKDVLAGRVRFNAVLKENGKTVADSTGAWVGIGVRERLDLAGEWTVKSARPFPVELRDYKPELPEPLPESVAMPAALSKTPFAKFRGWLAFAREISWDAKGKAPGRFVAEGVSDSVAVKINGVHVGEMLPESELADTLGKWRYFHGENRNPAIKGRDDARQLIDLITDFDAIPFFGAPLPEIAGGKAQFEIELRGTSGRQHGIHGGMYLEMLPKTHFNDVAFTADMEDGRRVFTFTLDAANNTGKPFRGRVRAVYGVYAGQVPYTGACAPADEEFVNVTIPAGGGKVTITRRETPRFATCRATFVLMDGGKVLDATGCDYHTVAVEIRDRRDMYLNNERFFVKGRGSIDSTPNQRWQMRLNNVNMRRNMNSAPLPRFPEMRSRASWVDMVYGEGLLHSAGPLLTSCEKCEFWNPDDTSNIDRAVWSHLRTLYNCPGIIQWEATNELYGETPESRVAIRDAFHKLDPYKRPVVMTKGGGEWEAETEDGRVPGPDIVGIQYLGTREAIDAITATITEQPIQSTEINWFDNALMRDGLWDYGLDRGICGALLFDYSGRSLDQAAPDIPPGAEHKDDAFGTMLQSHRNMYQDLLCTARRAEDGRVAVLLSNKMPFVLRDLKFAVHNGGTAGLAELAPGQGFEMTVPATAASTRQGEGPHPWVVVHATYTTHGGLPHEVVLFANVPAKKN